MRWRVIIPGIVLIALVGVLGYGLTRDPHTLPSVLVGHPAPPFDLPTLDNPQHTIGVDAMKGRVALVNVWASWCVACRSEVSVIAELSQRTGVPVLGLDYKDDRDEAHRWLRRFGDPYARIAFDAKGQTGIDWGISGVPETFVLDRHGIIRDKVVGPVTDETMNDRLIPLIEKLRAEGG
ncbi:DsbE family thiol:disulfide interchange protein [Salinisphaera sp. Q1T1-3]|uniref:DsbE family thiol:disulfide interchange protein n=1 Tax=Salinisphaera sp. Q1T1-3 TaxID=2321229 RepID=UPI000E70BF3A|nr:DsbE family thiol:disulfide interchange protein [Salinisphaera sp. Q1T1-3]RJS92070.1 DsbE family thiol:disulfide interchange protein [Salinisphaera sp. Q1T1-3]